MRVCLEKWFRMFFIIGFFLDTSSIFLSFHCVIPICLQTCCNFLHKNSLSWPIFAVQMPLPLVSFLLQQSPRKNCLSLLTPILSSVRSPHHAIKIVPVTSDFHIATSSGHFSVLIFLKLSAAFDTVSYSLSFLTHLLHLLCGISHFSGLPIISLAFLLSFLNNSFSVFLNSFFSFHTYLKVTSSTFEA